MIDVRAACAAAKKLSMVDVAGRFLLSQEACFPQG